MCVCVCAKTWVGVSDLLTVFSTVAILVQGTHWTVAISQAFCSQVCFSLFVREFVIRCTDGSNIAIPRPGLHPIEPSLYNCQIVSSVCVCVCIVMRARGIGCEAQARPSNLQFIREFSIFSATKIAIAFLAKRLEKWSYEP